MRKFAIGIAITTGIIVAVVAGALFYAARNLNSIIADNRDYLLGRVSTSLGRKVEVAKVQVSLRWGVAADLTGVKIADDSAISDRPFVEASEVRATVGLMPLLARQIHITQIRLKNPSVRIIRTEHGNLNISTLGKKPSEATASTALPERAPGAIKGAPITGGQPTSTKSPDLAGLYVRSFVVDHGQIVYEERGPRRQAVALEDVDLNVDRFSLNRSFDVRAKLAAFSQRQNVEIAATSGPIVNEGKLDVMAAPFKINAKLGPILLARLREVGVLANAIPEELSISGPVTLTADADGSLNALAFHVASDLTRDRVAWGDLFDKPTSIPLKFSGDGSRAGSEIRIGKAKLQLGDLDATASKIALDGRNVSARIDTNLFDLASLSKVVGPLQKYDASGRGEIHLDASVTNKQPSANGTITLASVSVTRPNETTPMVNNLSGDIKLHGNAADAGPLKLNLGSGHAILTAHANSLQPVVGQYDLKVDNLKVADFVPSRPAEEHLANLAVNGKVTQGNDLTLTANVSSSDGDLANVPYNGLATAVTMVGKQINVQSLKLDAFKGSVNASGQATLADRPQFALNLAANNIDLQQALLSQKSKAADMIRGALTGQVQVSGAGSEFEQIKPTLKGNGRASIANGKLIGVNVGGEALKKVDNLPQIGSLVPVAVIQRHPELFSNPDTDLQNASLTFVLQGPKLTTRDLLAQTQDYSLMGDGWFDFDKKIDMLIRLVLTKQLTDEIIAAKQNVVYVTNRQRQIEVPARVTGQLPKPGVYPDVQQLARQAAEQALHQQGEKAVGKFLGKKGIPGVPFAVGGGAGGAPPPGGSATPEPAKPLDVFKKFVR